MRAWHQFASSRPDSPDTSLIRPSDWNAAHPVAVVLTNATGTILTTGDVVKLSTTDFEAVRLLDPATDHSNNAILLVCVGGLPASSSHTLPTTVANGAQGLFGLVGIWPTRVTAAVSQHDRLGPSSTTGLAASPSGRIIALATTTGADVIDCFWPGPPARYGAGHSRVRGLVGNPGATPDAQYTLSAHQVVLGRASTGDSIVVDNVSALTTDVTVAGPAAGGRDQAAAFPANSWIHLYFIWNGSAVNTISSLTAPPTGPTLPSGYTHWAYATTLRYNATPVLVRSYARGSWVLTQALTNLVLAGGSGTVAETAVDVSAAVPPAATVYALVATAYVQPSTVSAFHLRLRVATGIDLAVFRGAAQGNQYDSSGGFVILPNVGASFRYALDVASGSITDRNIRIDCLGYRVPNGD